MSTNEDKLAVLRRHVREATDTLRTATALGTLPAQHTLRLLGELRHAQRALDAELARQAQEIEETPTRPLRPPSRPEMPAVVTSGLATSVAPPPSDVTRGPGEVSLTGANWKGEK